MAKTSSQRRQDKRSASLEVLQAGNHEDFSRVWDTYLRGWVCEVRARARAQRSGSGEERHLRIFDVLAQARRLAEGARAMNNAQVVLSLITLRHECAHAVAAIYDARLYSFHQDCSDSIRNINVKNRIRG